MKKLFLCCCLGILVLVPSVCAASETITGHYCYTYGDKESLQGARDLTRTLAIRNAIESFRIYIESTSKVTNFTLTNDLVQTISSGYLKNVKITNHTEEGRTICDEIEGSVDPAEVEKVIKNQMSKRTQKIENMGIANNGYLKILRSYEKDHYSGGITTKVLHVVCVSLKRYHSRDSYQSNLPDSLKVFANFYDASNNPIITIVSSVDFGAYQNDIYPNQVILAYFNIPDGTKSYNVGLYGGNGKKNSEKSGSTKRKSRVKEPQ